MLKKLIIFIYQIGFMLVPSIDIEKSKEGAGNILSATLTLIFFSLSILLTAPFIIFMGGFFIIALGVVILIFSNFLEVKLFNVLGLTNIIGVVSFPKEKPFNIKYVLFAFGLIIFQLIFVMFCLVLPQYIMLGYHLLVRKLS